MYVFQILQIEIVFWNTACVAKLCQVECDNDAPDQGGKAMSNTWSQKPGPATLRLWRTHKYLFQVDPSRSLKVQNIKGDVWQ